MNKKDECLKIYLEAFGNDEPDFTASLFENCLGSCVVFTSENQMASMFFALQCKIETTLKKLPAIYIYAAATSKNLRGQGFMTKLLEEYIKALNEDTILFLRPANDGLISFYKNCGFKEICGINDNKNLPRVIPLNSFADITNDITSGDGEEFTLMYYSKKQIEFDKLNFIFSME